MATLNVILSLSRGKGSLMVGSPNSFPPPSYLRSESARSGGIAERHGNAPNEAEIPGIDLFLILNNSGTEKEICPQDLPGLASVIFSGENVLLSRYWALC